MGRKRIGGFVFEWYVGDHRPYHIHVYKNSIHLGRFDLETQTPMKGLHLSGDLRRALILGGFIDGGKQDGRGKKK